MTPRLKYFYTGALASRLAASRELRVFGAAHWLGERQDRLFHESTDPLLRLYRRHMAAGLALFVIRLAAAAVVVTAAVEATALGRLSVGQFVAGMGALVGAHRFSGLVERLPANLAESAAFLPDFFSVVDHSQDGGATAGGARVSDSLIPTVTFEDVSFAYPGQQAPVLDHLDLTLASGEITALVGGNGAGKSTIVKLLCGFYEPTSGRVTIDGTDLRELDPEIWRAHIAAVLQGFVQYPLTAAENVLLASDQRPDRSIVLEDSLREAGAVRLVSRLPQGAETVLDRRFGGVGLSGGEWQRLALARALAAARSGSAGLLLLDEPTAAMDVPFEHALFERFTTLASGRTTLLISHRLSTVRMADRVVMLAGGRVVEDGTHDSLVRDGGLYRDMWVAQSARFAKESGQ